MLRRHGAQPRVLVRAFVVKILPWWRAGSSDALEREEKFFFLQPNGKVFSGYCLLYVLNSGIHLWQKYLRRSNSANYSDLLKCRPFPPMKVALEMTSWATGMLLWESFTKVQLPDVWNIGTDLSHVVVIETAALRLCWDAFLPEASGPGREELASQSLGQEEQGRWTQTLNKV